MDLNRALEILEFPNSHLSKKDLQQRYRKLTKQAFPDYTRIKELNIARDYLFHNISFLESYWEYEQQEFLLDLGFYEAILGHKKQFRYTILTPNGEKEIIKTIKIPKGIQSGEKLKIKEHNIILKMSVCNVDTTLNILRMNLDLHFHYYLPYSSFILGDTVDVFFPYITEKYEIDPLTEINSKIRLSGKGIWSDTKKISGDAYLNLQLKRVQEIDSKKRDALEHLKKCGL